MNSYQANVDISISHVGCVSNGQCHLRLTDVYANVSRALNICDLKLTEYQQDVIIDQKMESSQESNQISLDDPVILRRGFTGVLFSSLCQNETNSTHLTDSSGVLTYLRVSFSHEIRSLMYCLVLWRFRI